MCVGLCHIFTYVTYSLLNTEYWIYAIYMILLCKLIRYKRIPARIAITCTAFVILIHESRTRFVEMASRAVWQNWRNDQRPHRRNGQTFDSLLTATSTALRHRSSEGNQPDEIDIVSLPPIVLTNVFCIHFREKWRFEEWRHHCAIVKTELYVLCNCNEMLANRQNCLLTAKETTGINSQLLCLFVIWHHNVVLSVGRQ